LNRSWRRREGPLGHWLSVAHGVWFTPAERDLLAAHRVTVVHNPASNPMLGSGIMPLLEAQQAGLRFALGTDSANNGGAGSTWFEAHCVGGGE
jgi:5-methylthioadenosine/S-adenosylhomocysteine deaminase